MSAMEIGLISLAFIFGGALVGISLRALLPEDHLAGDSRDVVRLGVGLVVTMAALVLSLMISSAKASYATQSAEITDMSSKVVFLDRILAHYGPETKEARDLLHVALVRVIDQMWSEKQSGPSRAEAPSTDAEILYDKIQELPATTEAQRSLQAQALNIVVELGQARWLMYEQRATSASLPLLSVLIFWLTIIFISFGLFAPSNTTVIVSLFLTAFSVSGAIYLIVQTYSPYTGLGHISSAPLQAALAQLGQ
jgi:hypothetical protein